MFAVIFVASIHYTQIAHNSYNDLALQTSNACQVKVSLVHIVSVVWLSSSNQTFRYFFPKKNFLQDLNY